jgi:plasmid stability protein
MKRATVYLDEDLHRALKVKAAEASSSVSDLVNDAIRQSFAEDLEDLQAFRDRANEPTVSFEEFLRKLKADGKL